MLKEVLWIVAGLVVMMLGLSWVMLDNMTTDAVIWKDANELMRTAGQVGLLLLGILAYRKWRRPEDARRRADAAQEIMRLSRALEGRISAG